jgi:hypothetical protein
MSKTRGRPGNALIARYLNEVRMKHSKLAGRINTTGWRLKPLSCLKPKYCGFGFQGVCPLETWGRHNHLHLPRAGSVADYIVIPAEARSLELSSFDLSVRLQNILGWKGCRVLGDLHGVRLSELARWRNCGKTTVLELLGIVRCLQHGNWKGRTKPDLRDMAGNYEI